MPSFDLVKAVKKAQAKAEKRLKADEAEALKALNLIEEKYPWIKDPFREGKPDKAARRDLELPPAIPEKQKAAENGQLVQCVHCGRRFAPERIEKHMNVCVENPVNKSKAAKRGRMDMTAKRVGGV